MIDRRDWLKIGATTSLALGIPAALRAGAPSLDLWVRDVRFAMPGEAATRAGATRQIDGDVTALWTGTLDSAWNKRGFVVAGMTGSDALFVLEQLAWSRGRRVVEKRQIAAVTADQPALFYWRIEPVHPSMTA